MPDPNTKSPVSRSSGTPSDNPSETPTAPPPEAPTDELTTDIDDEFADATERGALHSVPINRHAFLQPAVWQAVLGIALGVAAVTWPHRTNRVLATLLGIGLLWQAATTLLRRGSSRSNRARRVLIAASLATVGAAFVTLAGERSLVLGRLLGIAFAVAAIIAITMNWRRRQDGVAPALALALFGALTFSFPDQVFTTAITVIALGWIGLSILVLVRAFSEEAAEAAGFSDATAALRYWVQQRPKSASDREALYDKILFDGPQERRKVIRFFTLMAFAATIASMGVIADSTAVVIGAMLIAPLMTPLMGIAISLVMGWPNRLAKSALLALGGIALAISIGAILSALVPAMIDTTQNSQILARATPTLLDLITALAAGAAGAYALSRPDVSDSLPGVAIAISLVPPLTVVGICFAQGDFTSGIGALLLFTTNMLAIVVMGGLTFIVTGVTPVSRVAEHQSRMRTASATVAILACVVIGGLFLNGARIARNIFDTAEASDTVAAWLGASSRYRVIEVSLREDSVIVNLAGPAAGVPDVDRLALRLSDALDRRVEVDIRLTVEQRITSSPR
jgi:uncharacterized hydrophobic protein (TIGR00271 family)